MATYHVTITVRPGRTDEDLIAAFSNCPVPVTPMCSFHDKDGSHHVLAVSGRDDANRIHAIASGAGFPVSYVAAEPVR